MGAIKTISMQQLASSVDSRIDHETFPMHFQKFLARTILSSPSQLGTGDLVSSQCHPPKGYVLDALHRSRVRESCDTTTRLHPPSPLIQDPNGVRKTSTTHQTDTHLCPFCESEAIEANTYAPRSPNSTFNRFKIERFHFHN